jgi:hypothetical protein
MPNYATPQEEADYQHFMGLLTPDASFWDTLKSLRRMPPYLAIQPDGPVPTTSGSQSTTIDGTLTSPPLYSPHQSLAQLNSWFVEHEYVCSLLSKTSLY